jgi:hypothetical protein
MQLGIFYSVVFDFFKSNMFKKQFGIFIEHFSLTSRQLTKAALPTRRSAYIHWENIAVFPTGWNTRAPDHDTYRRRL